jgi:NADH dehydrogenase
MKPTGTVCVFGGTGFIGRHLCNRLSEQGYQIRVPTRRRERGKALLVNPAVSVIETDVYQPQALDRLLADCEVAINLVGILNESGFDGSGFQRAHVELPRLVVEACRRQGLQRLLHMSALNAAADVPQGHYLRTKGQGEDLVHAAAGDDLRVTSFRPSVIFGADDSFLNRFANLLRLTPGVFPLACAGARFAPVYVQDVVSAFAYALTHEETVGQRYELCGPGIYTLKELVEQIARTLGLKRMVVDLPDFAGRLQARILERLPGKPFSMDNYWSLQIDSICREDGFAALGIQPQSLDTLLPRLLGGRGSRGRYQDYRKNARR